MRQHAGSAAAIRTSGIPRSDVGEARFWRIDRTADYGLLNGLARYRLNTELIANNWDDMLRVAGSLKLGALSASEFMRTIQSGSRTSTLVRAIAELGRIAKTLFLLALRWPRSPSPPPPSSAQPRGRPSSSCPCRLPRPPR